MSEKQRNQNPTTGDTIVLKLFTYKTNSRADLATVESVKIYQIEGDEKTTDNPQGLRLVETIDGSDVEKNDTGEYQASVELSSPTYVIGQYVDEWNVTFVAGGSVETIANRFQIYPDMWYADGLPPVYDFAFDFRPNRLRQGSRQYLTIGIFPNVPRGSDLDRYYLNLAIVSPLKISIEMSCVECMPAEADLRLIVDEDDVTLRDRGLAHYLLDTTDLACGIYNVWFTMEFGDSLFISEKNQLQVF